MLKAHACAKINLGLRVLRKRTDGYHDIDTILLRIGWFDTVVVTPAARLTFRTDAAGIPEGEDNLCYKAACELQRRFARASGAAISLNKSVPAGAGLGGGSADAAATLLLLNDLWDLQLPRSQLGEIGAAIGSDIPFFVTGRTVERGTGRGDRLVPLHGYDFPFALVVVVPERRVSTAWAYKIVTPEERRQTRELEDIVRTNDLSIWRRELRNDFEAVVVQQFPEIGKIRERLYENGAAYASMSGSGSAVYGVFEDISGAEKAVAESAGAWSAARAVVWTGTASS